MFAVIAAVLFGLALILQLTHSHLDAITWSVLVTAGLLFFALHFATTHSWSRRR